MSEPKATFSEARKSATVVLVREGEKGPEMLLVLRHAKAAFGASYVFPGGVLEAGDQMVGDYCRGLDDEAASSMLSLSSGGAAYFSCAIRELFEEVGVLLARTATGGWADPNGYSVQREGLNSGKLLWPDFVSQQNLSLACDALHYFSFWITPREEVKRYSTRFFIAASPHGQHAEHCGGELTDSRWMGPVEAIAANEAGEIDIPHPTVLTLRQFSEFPTIEQMLESAAKCSNVGVTCYLPAVVTINGERRVVMPDSPDYPTYSEGG